MVPTVFLPSGDRDMTGHPTTTGGSGMIGLQEMLLQTNGAQILLFPAWPKEWNVHFKLHAPGNTTVEATLKDGKVTDLKVSPENRKKDIIIMIEK